jgi:hypothetical protein
MLRSSCPQLPLRPFSRQSTPSSATSTAASGLPTTWKLLGTEIQGPNCTFDIVWQHTSSGRVLVDELKTGKAGDLVGGQELDEQLERECRGGRELYDRRFVGVRLLILAAPRRSFLVSPDARTSFLYTATAS